MFVQLLKSSTKGITNRGKWDTEVHLYVSDVKYASIDIVCANIFLDK